MYLPKYVEETLQTLNEAGYEAYVVGGCVRDFVMKNQPHDYDICTSALPDEIESLFERTIPTGKKHGTITVLKEEPLEITTFRTEEDYSDHRHPDTVKFVSKIAEDLSRRDFTINAMAYHPKTGIIDPFSGQEDIKKRMIRCVGNPDKRFEEDALRMLRAHRFCAKLMFTMEKETKRALDEKEALLKHVSVERIRDEVNKILLLNPFQIKEMTSLLKPWIPELEECKNCEQISPWHQYNVLDHTLHAMVASPVKDETILWTLFFHDLGKPACKTTVEGRDHFYAHALVSKMIAKRIMRDWKFTSKMRHDIPILIEYHDDSIRPSLKTIYSYRIQRGWSEEFMEKWLIVRRCDLLAHSSKGQQTLLMLDEFENLYRDCLKKCPMECKDLAITGKDIVKNTDCKGEEIQEKLVACLTLCFYQPQMNQKDRLIEFIKK